MLASLSANSALTYVSEDANDIVTYTGIVSRIFTNIIGINGSSFVITGPDAGTCLAYNNMPNYAEWTLLLTESLTAQKPITMTCYGWDASIKSIKIN